MTLAQFFEEESGLFARAFEPLRTRLSAQAQESMAQKTLPPWLTHLGKGGVHRRPEDVSITDVSLYRHCMEVAVVASYLFYYAWHNGKLANVAPGDTEAARSALCRVLAIAFTHDADKYGGGPRTKHWRRFGVGSR